MSDEREQHTWLSNALRRSPAGADGGCPDAETLAAWTDGGLSAKAASIVELHASNCPHCIEVLAELERSAPATTARYAWIPARLFRWLVPLAAAATAVAIWVAVPDRPVTSDRPQGLKTAPAQPATPMAVPVPIPVPEAAPVPDPAPERGTANAQTQLSSAEPATRNPESAPQAQFRDDFRRENAAPQSFGAAAGADANEAGAPETSPEPTAAAPSPSGTASVPPAAAQSAPSAGRADADAAPSANRLNETVTLNARRSMLGKAAESSDSIAPTNSLYRWRIVATRIERSINGAKTWTRTRVPPGSPIGVRAVDADRAVVRTSDNAEFYTIDGGRSWTRVQENSAAPF